MEQKPGDAASKALLFANGLRKNVATTGVRWKAWPRGERDLAGVLATIDSIAQRLRALPPEGSEAELAVAFTELRAVLEWTTYQSSSVALARALTAARRTRALAERFNLLADKTDALLADSEESFIGNVRTRNEYMAALAERYPQLGFPLPLITPETLAPKVEKAPGRLDLIQQLTKSKRPNRR
jgi:hypothetical protein